MAAPRVVGFATYVPSTEATITLRNSSSPSGEETFFPMTDSNVSGIIWFEDKNPKIIGFKNSSAVTSAEEGYPGIPITGLPETEPNITG